MPRLAEERGLGCEESEVLALVIQAAVPTAHAVTAGHGGGQHCVDGHGEVQGQPLAPEKHPSSTLAARGSDGLSRSDTWPQSESTRVQLLFTHPEIVCTPVLMHPEALDPTCEGETGELGFDSALWVLPERRPGNARASNRRVTSSCHACECV